MDLPLIDFENVYQYYLVKGKEDQLPVLQESWADISKTFNEITEPIKNINTSNAANSFTTKIKQIRNDANTKERNSIENSYGEDAVKVYDKLNYRNKIIFLTELYFTGTSQFFTQQDLKKKQYIQIEVDKLNNLQSFLLIASSAEFTQLMKKHESAITIKRSEINKTIDGLRKATEEEKDKSALQVLKSLFDKNPLLKVQGTKMNIDPKIIEQIKEEIQKPNTWNTVKNNIKTIIKNNASNFNTGELGRLIILKDEQDSEENAITLATVQIISDATVYIDKLRSEVDQLSLTNNQLNFTSFKLDITEDQLKKLKAKAKSYIGEKSKDSPLLLKIAKKEQDTDAYSIKANISSASGALGEITALLGGEQLLGNQNQLTGRLTGTDTVNGISSFADVKFNDEKTGLNVKHYTPKTFNLYDEGDYSILGDSILNQYINSSELLAIKFIEINHNFFYNNSYSKAQVPQELKSYKDLNNRYKLVGLNNISNFFRQTSQYEPDYTNIFYIINNSVIPASFIFDELLTTFNFTKLKNTFFDGTKSDPLKIQTLDENHITVDTNKIESLKKYLNTSGGGVIHFNGLRISVEALSKDGRSKLSVNKAK